MKSIDALERPLYQLFTVVIDLDHELNVSSVSSLVSRNVPELRVGQPLTSAFELIRPRSLTPDSVESKLDYLVLMISRESRYPIRGQIFHSTKKIGGYVLVGSPWLSRMVEEGNENYSLSDFPLHDAQVDWLFMLGAEKQQVKELRRLSSELEQAKDAAEAAIDSKSKFFAVMSHEMRTPLNAIIGAIQLMPVDKLDAELRQLLDVSSGAANQLLSVINDVLDFSKIEAGKMALEHTRFELAELFDAVINIVSLNAENKQLQLDYTIADDVPEILEGDDGKIKQILLNLSANALKFTEQGSVRINARKLPRQESGVILRIEVCDTGAGISAENQSKLFDQFWTSSPESGFQGRGTGLGLDIAKRLTELMGGKIGVESELGKGSIFWIEIPVEAVSVDVKVPQAAVVEAYDAQAILKGKRILVAEDNQANQLIARLSLEKLGMVVDIASNGLEAVDAVSKRPYDIVFMDIGMPEMTGYEAAAEIRQTLQNTRLPIIACTAHLKTSSTSEGMAVHFNDYLPKPITKENMLNILLKWLGQQQSRYEAPNSQPGRGDAEGTAIIDRKVVEQLAEDLGQQYLGQALTALKTEITSRLMSMSEAHKQRAYEPLAREAHALKSGALSFGAYRLGQVLNDIEQMAEQGSDQVWSTLETLSSVCDSTVEELNNFS